MEIFLRGKVYSTNPHLADQEMFSLCPETLQFWHVIALLHFHTSSDMEHVLLLMCLSVFTQYTH